MIHLDDAKSRAVGSGSLSQSTRGHGGLVGHGSAFAWLILCVLLFPAQALSGVIREYRYRETTGSESVEFLYRVEQEVHATITCSQPDETRRTVCSLSGATLEWETKDADRDIAARLVDGQIRVNGVVQGKPVAKAFPKDDVPWFQLLSFSLRPFVQSHETVVVFQMLRPDNLSVVKLEAKKVGGASVTVGGEALVASRVRVSPPWPLSLAWRGYYWFRESDGLFLRYEGINGPPGTAKTVVQLLE